MDTKLSLTVLLVIFVAAGCGEKPESAPPAPAALPEVNNENCKTENIAKLDPSIRQHFADACFKSGTYKPSSGRTW
jgi:entry exclusion lipoprotein TrbK